MNSSIELKPVKDLLGMNFYIPDYQRGYRWEKQQAVDLLEDIFSFSVKNRDIGEIYCIQPLVVSEKEEDILAKCKSPEASLEDIRKYIKGSWNVVDGQQRLTTIYLLLKAMNFKNSYEIDYCTRSGSKAFLKDIESKTENDARENIDYYHMYSVYTTIREWLGKKQPDERELIKEVLLNKVNFIWYQIDEAEEIAVFTRLNIGKIPLTDSELVKALFLNRGNFNSIVSSDKYELDSIQKQIATEWDQIEYALQDDEFWAFINNSDYSKPTRIDFILDSICRNDRLKIYKDEKKYRNSRKNNNKDRIKEENALLYNKIGSDEHRIFRYFNEAFIRRKNNVDIKWLYDLWVEIKKYYQIFCEWYHDYRLYHYIGYLTLVAKGDTGATEYVSLWDGIEKDKFVAELKNKIVDVLKKKSWIKALKDYKFDQDGNQSKRECVDILLLHNIETIVQQNEKLVSEAKYNLPNFSKFPFHLYKRENWQVEHIRPNAGDNLEKEDAQKLYLSLAREYFENDTDLCKKIDDFINDPTLVDFASVLTSISQKGGILADEDKNRIWNYVLLDETTNKEYGNQIFPVKRAFIINKEQGKKIKYSFKNGHLVEEESVSEIAFVPPCTKNVFSKSYTVAPMSMVNWNQEDAKAYWNDIVNKLNFYFKELGII